MDSAACLACMEAMSGGKRIRGSEFVAMTRVPRPGPSAADGFESTQPTREMHAQSAYVPSPASALGRRAQPGLELLGRREDSFT